MSIRLTIDHSFTIVDAEAGDRQVAVSACAATSRRPSRNWWACASAAASIARCASGWAASMAAPHIVELLGPVATTAFQTVSSKKASDLNRAHREQVGDLAAEEIPTPRQNRAASPTCSTPATPGPSDGRSHQALGPALLHRPRRRSGSRGGRGQRRGDGRLTQECVAPSPGLLPRSGEGHEFRLSYSSPPIGGGYGEGCAQR